MRIKSPPSLTTPEERGQSPQSPSKVNTDKPSDELRDLEEASVMGDLDRLHTIYSTWFAKQRPEPSTGIICKNPFDSTARHAATHDQPAILAYILSQGLKLDRYLLKEAVLSGSTRVLQVLIDHGWNINEPEAYCDPPFLGYVVTFPTIVVPPANSRLFY